MYIMTTMSNISKVRHRKQFQRVTWHIKLTSMIRSFFWMHL
jgi:hypothetical protein